MKKGAVPCVLALSTAFECPVNSLELKSFGSSSEKMLSLLREEVCDEVVDVGVAISAHRLLPVRLDLAYSR